jgi:hypothetical protein
MAESLLLMQRTIWTTPLAFIGQLRDKERRRAAIYMKGGTKREIGV